MGVIFDLDQTLIDSSAALQARSARNWNAVNSLIPRFIVYDGITDLLNELVEMGIPTCIVTSSPESYCKNVLAHHSLNIPLKVCYHDTRNKKPHPEPINLALSKLGLPANKVLSVGDDPKDIVASHSAGIKKTVGAFWGSNDEEGLAASKPAFCCQTVEQLREIIFNHFPKKK